MSESSSRQAEQLFLVALELEPEKRSAFLDEACAGNPEMRAEVGALLEASVHSSEYFKELPGRLGVAGLMRGAGSAEDAQAAGEAGQQYGQYRLTEPVGSGGMGAVWRAERSDGRFEGEVAVKLLARGTGVAAAERFAREARYLAKLAHPNIARLLDAGVGDNGQPYLVLEFVEGMPIDRYCDEHALGIEQRIRLFLAVLDAVAHAHANLIVHRDIKPSNVQVAADGTVKLLDFGVAKLLSDEVTGTPGLTRELGAALTPEFAAPEQLNGETVTTATDVYSLGLLLWLLVTGSNPREAAEPRSLAELRELAQKEPTRLLDAVTDSPSPERLAQVAERRNASPSELTKTLRSDLDNIVRKALAVSPAERYETVADFAQDLRRYLQNEPVTAQAQTIRYRALKFVRRHRGGVLAASLTAIALIGAVIITTWQTIEARRQRDIALYHQHRVQATNDFLSVLLTEVGAGDEPLTLVDLLDRGVAMLDEQFGAEDRFVARTLWQISLYYGTLGRTERRLELLRRSEQIAREADDRDLLALLLCDQSRVQLPEDPAASGKKLELGQAVLSSLRDPSIDARQACYRAEAQALEAAGDREGALAALEAALRAIEESVTPSAAARTVILNDLSEQYYKVDRVNEALAMNAELLEMLDRTGRGGTLSKVIYLMNRAAILGRMGEIVAAAEAQEQALERLKQRASSEHMLIGASAHYAASLLRLARYEEALELAASGRAAAAAVDNTRWLANDDLLMGMILARMGRNEEAENHLAAAEAVYRKNSGSNTRRIEQLELTRVLMMLHGGDVAAALDAVNSALQRAGYPQRKDAPGLSSILLTAAKVALAAGDAVSAEQYANDGYEYFLGIARDPSLSGYIGQLLLLRARARHAQGEDTAAAADLEQALISLVNGLGEEHPDTVEARELLASLP